MDFNSIKNEELDKVLDKIRLNDEGGITWNGLDDTVENFVELLLDNELKIVESFARYGYSRAYVGSMVYRSLAKLKKDAIPTYTKLLSNLNDEKKMSRKKEYLFAFPLNISRPSYRIQRTYIIEKIKLKIVDGAYIYAKATNRSDKLYYDLHHDPKIKLYTEDIPTFILVKIRSRDAQYAADEAYRKVSIFLALLNFAKYGFKDVRKYPIPYPISEIQMPYSFYYFDDKEKYQYNFMTEKGPIEKTLSLDADSYKKFLRFYRKFSSLKTRRPLYNRFVSALIKYQDAITSTLSDSANKYWMCLEKLFIKTEKQSHNDLLNRIFVFMLKPIKVIEVRMRTIKTKRNQLIHNLEDRFLSSEANLLRNITEMALYFYMGELNNFDEQDLCYLLDQEPNVKMINKRMKMLQYMRKEIKRRQKKKR